MVLGKLPVPGCPTLWITAGQGPTALAVGAGGGCMDIFTLIYPFSPFSPSLWETARHRLKYCLKGPLNPKQPTNQFSFSYLKTVYCVSSLESPHRGDFDENTQYTFMLQKIKEILIKLPGLALLSTLIGSNYPCLELIFMVPEVFEPLKFDCNMESVLL